MPTRRSQYQKNYGFPSPLKVQFPDPIIMKRNPTIQDDAVIGQEWINTVSGAVFFKTMDIPGGSFWFAVPLTAAAGNVFNTITVTPGDANITNGNLNVLVGNATIAGAIQGATLQSTGATVVGTNLAVGGTLNVAGATTFAGAVTYAGGLALDSAAPITIVDTFNGAGAISLTANGGPAETVLIESLQGTGAGAVTLNAAAGGIILDAFEQIALVSTEAGAASIFLNANNADGGVSISSQTGGISLVTTGIGIFNTGTGNLHISNDNTDTTIDIGDSVGTTKTIIMGGTGPNIITIGNQQTAGTVAIGGAMTTGTVSIGGLGAQTGAINIAPGTGVQAVNIANAAGAKIVNIANGVSGNIVAINAGTNVAPNFVSIMSGTAAAAQTFSVMSNNATAGLQTVNIQTGTSVGGNLTNIATGAAVQTVTIGSTNTTSSTIIQAGTAGIVLNSSTGIVRVITQSVTVAGVVATNNARVAQVIFTGQAIAPGADLAVTVNNALITPTSVIIATVTQQAGNDGSLYLSGFEQVAGSFTANVYNNSVDGSTGSILLNFWLMN